MSDHDDPYPRDGNTDTVDHRRDSAPAEETLVRIAWYYYKDGLTQAQIAERVGVSRASIGRHLVRARESGLVQIDI